MRTGSPPPMPKLFSGGYLARVFVELGCVQPIGDGRVLPLSFSEMRAAFDWLSERERLVIRQMSRAYIRGWNTGTDVLGIAPWEPKDS